MEFITWLEGQFNRLPHLSPHIRGVFIKIAPGLSLVFGILGILGTVGIIGSQPLALERVGNYFFTGAFALAASVLLLMAYPKLKRMQYRGWIFLFWSEILGSVALVFPPSLGAVISLLVGLYILFQIKNSYH